MVDAASASDAPLRPGDSAAFGNGVVNAEAVLVATIQGTWRDLARVESETAAARAIGNGADASRAVAIGLRTKDVLVRQLKEYACSVGHAEPQGDLAAVATVFDALLAKPLDEPIDARVALEATTRALLEKLRAVEAEYQTAVRRHPQSSDRVLSKFLKTQATVERALQRLHEVTHPREVLRQKFEELGLRMAEVVTGACQEVIKEYGDSVRAAVNDLLAQRVRPADLLARLGQLDTEWDQSLTEKVILALRPLAAESRRW